MSNEIQFIHNITGDTVYAVIVAPTSQWANITNSVLEAVVVADWTEYAVTLTETPASSYFYLADFPSWITTVGVYGVIFFSQAGGSPAITDPKIRPEGLLGWDGTQEIDTADINTVVNWLKNVAEGDNSIDTSDATQFQSVVKIKNTDTDLIRKDLQETDATPILTLNTIVGKQVEP